MAAERSNPAGELCVMATYTNVVTQDKVLADTLLWDDAGEDGRQ